MTENETSEEGFDHIVESLIEKIEIPSIKNSLKDKIIINRITSDGIYLITISKVAQLIFNNKEHMKYIEEKVYEVTQRPMAIHVSFENKETYFAKKLGLDT